MLASVAELREVLSGPFGINLPNGERLDPALQRRCRRRDRLMAPVNVDPDKVREFKDEQAFYDWLGKHHDSEDEVWIKIHKVGSGLPSITPKEAIDVVLCWGWIDAIRKGFDDKSFLQRYTPRGKKSIWSQINVDNVARLIEEGRMTEHGLKRGRGGQGRRALGPRLWQRQGHEDPGRPAGGDRRRAGGEGDARQAQRAEPLRARLPHPQPEDRGRAEEEDRRPSSRC